MQVERFEIEGPRLLTPAYLGDARGWFAETYNEKKWRDAGVFDNFVQDNQSLSTQIGTLRGLHFQIEPHAQAKLLHVVAGEIMDVIVDIRPSSTTFGQHLSVVLNSVNHAQLYVPKGFAHGFITRTKNTEVCYKVSDFYAPAQDCGLIWNDIDLNINWGHSNPELSEKDRNLPTLAQYLKDIS